MMYSSGLHRAGRSHHMRVRCFLTLMKPPPSEHHIGVHHYRTSTKCSFKCSFYNGAVRATSLALVKRVICQLQ